MVLVIAHRDDVHEVDRVCVCVRFVVLVRV